MVSIQLLSVDEGFSRQCFLNSLDKVSYSFCVLIGKIFFALIFFLFLVGLSFISEILIVSFVESFAALWWLIPSLEALGFPG